MSNRSYIEAQFDKLISDEDVKSALKIIGAGGGSTHFLGVTNKQLEKIKLILLEGCENE